MQKGLVYLLDAFKGESIKVKNTIGFWSALIFPAMITFLNFMIYLNRPKLLIESTGNTWILFTRNSLTMWGMLFLPLFIGIITFYINYVDHKANGWKHLYALPIPKWSIYTSKLIISILVVALSTVFFFIINYSTMKFLQLINPAIPFYKHMFPSIIMMIFLKTMLASMGIIAIQFVISILFQNFLYPLGFSVIATFSALFLFGWEKIVYYPYAYQAFAARDLVTGNSALFINPVIFSIVCFLIVSFTGYFIHSRLRVK
jgi:lantibiotic transport system permease protein